MHCHLHRGDWSFHLTNEKKKRKNILTGSFSPTRELALFSPPVALSVIEREGLDIVVQFKRFVHFQDGNIVQKVFREIGGEVRVLRAHQT